MSQGLTKPGMRSADLSNMRHPKTGELLVPLGFTKSGRAVWPVLGASSDDEDDPAFTGGDSDPVRRGTQNQDDDEDDEEDDDEDEKPASKKKSTKSEDDEDREPTRPERQAARYRVQLREAQAHNRELEARLRRIEDSDKPQDEILKRDLEELRGQAESLAEVNRILSSQLAFFKVNDVTWADPTDAFNLAEKAGLFDDVTDEDGTVDERQLRRALRDLAKRKPHLVKKSTARGQDSEDDEEEPSSRSSASTMNGSRKGKQKTGIDRSSLAKRFPVLNR